MKKLCPKSLEIKNKGIIFRNNQNKRNNQMRTRIKNKLLYRQEYPHKYVTFDGTKRSYIDSGLCNESASIRTRGNVVLELFLHKGKEKQEIKKGELVVLWK